MYRDFHKPGFIFTIGGGGGHMACVQHHRLSDNCDKVLAFRGLTNQFMLSHCIRSDGLYIENKWTVLDGGFDNLSVVSVC